MPGTNLQQVTHLLLKANKQGIKISYADGELSVKFPKEQQVDQDLLGELKENKKLLVEYFKKNRNGLPGLQQTNGSPFKMEMEGKMYYEISFFHNYWVDEKNWEYIKRLTWSRTYRFSEGFDVGAIERAVHYMLKRHEILRSTFHKIGEKYYMRVEDENSPRYAIDFRDLGDIPGEIDLLAENSIYLADPEYKLQQGPLFVVRVIRANEKEYLVSVKLIHAIYDGWTLELVIRDLLMAYSAYTKGEEPNLPRLKFQYKDYMIYLNQKIQLQADNDRQYWLSLFKTLPGELKLPGAKRNTTNAVRDGKKMFFSIPGKVVNKMSLLAKKYGTGLSVVFQASFKMYLYRITGQNDIVVGTMVSGRDNIPGSEDQLGIYSTTHLLRTILDSNDSFEDAIQKVKKSNADMHNHNAFPLISALMQMLPPGHQDWLFPFWKCSIHYIDMSGFFVDHSIYNGLIPRGTTIVHPVSDAVGTIVTDLDLKVDYYHFKDKMDASFFYDTDVYDDETINEMINEYLACLHNLTEE